MSTNITSNYALPTTGVTTKPNASSSSGKSSSDPTGLQNTFLSLLTQELQNQDPTAPMDSTAMVGQMISLNQLSQLISINQTLTGSGSSSSSKTQAQSSAQSVNDALASMASPAAGAMTSSLPSFATSNTSTTNPYNTYSQQHSASTMALALR